MRVTLLLVALLAAIPVGECTSGVPGSHERRLGYHYEKVEPMLLRGSPGRLTVDVAWTELRAPVRWTIEVRSIDGALVFRHEQDDTQFDSIFDDRGAWDGWPCNTYESCKRAYYDGLKEAVRLKNAKGEPRLVDRGYGASLMSSVRDELVQRHRLSLDEAERAISSLRRALQVDYVAILTLPSGPQSESARFVYVPEVDRFVPFGSG